MLGLRRSDKGHTGEGHGDWSCPSQLAVKHMQNQSLVGSLESAAPGPSFLRAPLLFSWNSWDCAVRVNQKVWVSPEDPRWPPSSHLQPRFTSCSHRGEGRGQKFAFSVEEVVPRAGRLPSAAIRKQQHSLETLRTTGGGTAAKMLIRFCHTSSQVASGPPPRYFLCSLGQGESLEGHPTLDFLSFLCLSLSFQIGRAHV